MEAQIAVVTETKAEYADFRANQLPKVSEEMKAAIRKAENEGVMSKEDADIMVGKFEELERGG